MDFNPLSTCIFLYFSWHVTQILVKPGKYPSEGVTIWFNREGGLEVRAVLLPSCTKQNEMQRKLTHVPESIICI